ncbi:hypothetical protein [Undibacterium sp.]|uniref:hypothetical protein n=1 Tax=Undibacterium sp. TaxID=1914977 RepID=UPI00374DD436
MISNQAKTGFDHLLSRALQSSLTGSSGNSCEVSIVPDLSDIEENRIVVLTISSYLFRLMVMIYFTPDEKTKSYFAGMNGMQPAEMGEQAFQDAIAECGNICCGILNRDLGAFFPHIGMSTPNMMDRHCASYLGMLNCDHIQHFQADVRSDSQDEPQDGSRFYVTLCVSAYANLDFAVDTNEESEATGELEMF